MANNHDEPCDKHLDIPFDDRKWHWFVLTSVMIFGSGIVLIIIGRLIMYMFHRSKLRAKSKIDAMLDEDDEEEESELEKGWYLDLKEGAGNLVSAQTLQGRILVR